MLHQPFGIGRKLGLVDVEGGADGDVDVVALFDARAGEGETQGADDGNRGERDQPPPGLQANAAKAERHHRDHEQKETPKLGDRYAEGEDDESEDGASRKNAGR